MKQYTGIKKTKREQIELKKRKAIDLYGQGFTTREIGRLVGRSRTWVSNTVREFLYEDKEKENTLR